MNPRMHLVTADLAEITDGNADAALIAAAVTALPALLDEVEALRAAVARVEEVRADLADAGIVAKVEHDNAQAECLREEQAEHLREEQAQYERDMRATHHVRTPVAGSLHGPIVDPGQHTTCGRELDSAVSFSTTTKWVTCGECLHTLQGETDA